MTISVSTPEMRIPLPFYYFLCLRHKWNKFSILRKAFVEERNVEPVMVCSRMDEEGKDRKT